MRVFVTGIAGFLGAHLAEAFIARGDQVSGVDNLVGGYEGNVPPGADWYLGDCNDFDRLKRALRGVEVVFHCAATAHEGLSVFSPHENARHGYSASAAVFSAACAMGVRRIIHCSSMARYGKGDGPPPFVETMIPRPEDPYGIGKYASELLLWNLAETHKIEAVVAVPHNIHGPKQCFTDPFRNVISIFANLMLQGKQPTIYGDGSQERCFSYVSDDVEPLAKMALQDNVIGETINIGPDSEVVSIKRVAEIVAGALNFPLDPIFKPDRPREVKFAHCSADKARRLLGYEAKVPLEEGIRKTVEWVKLKGPRPFSYRLDIEIDSPILPETWAKRLF
jgi:UDP-glucose 4-epimerase